MVTYANFIIGLRSYLEQVTGVTTIWKYKGYTLPDERPFITVDYVNSTYNESTKLKELVKQTIYINIGNYGADVISIAETQAKIMEVLQYHAIPLMNSEGEVIGSFSVDRVTGENDYPFGVDVEQESQSFRIFTDIAVELDHVKKRV